MRSFYGIAKTVQIGLAMFVKMVVTALLGTSHICLHQVTIGS